MPKPIDNYADIVLEMGDSHPSVYALIAKGIHSYNTENYVAARDYLNRGEYHIINRQLLKIKMSTATKKNFLI